MPITLTGRFDLALRYPSESRCRERWCWRTTTWAARGAAIARCSRAVAVHPVVGVRRGHTATIRITSAEAALTGCVIEERGCGSLPGLRRRGHGLQLSTQTSYPRMGNYHPSSGWIDLNCRPAGRWCGGADQATFPKNIGIARRRRPVSPFKSVAFRCGASPRSPRSCEKRCARKLEPRNSVCLP